MDSNALQAGPLHQIMADTDSLLVRQKLDVLAIFCPMCQRRNKYAIVQTPQGFPTEEWSDEMFWNQAMKLTAQEESSTCCRVCLGSAREFHMKVEEPNSHTSVMEIFRPFKCTLFCCCCLINPQELTVNAAGGQKKMGRVVNDFRCKDAYCGKSYYKVTNAEDETRFVVRDDICCNNNCFAPSCCCPVRKLDILNADESQTVGHLTNVFPGCNCRGVAGGVTNDNYRLDFPPNISAEDKALLLGSLFLIEYTLFETKNKDDDVDV